MKELSACPHHHPRAIHDLCQPVPAWPTMMTTLPEKSRP